MLLVATAFPLALTMFQPDFWQHWMPVEMLEEVGMAWRKGCEQAVTQQVSEK